MKDYLNFPENLNYKEFVIDVRFITIAYSTVKTLSKIFKGCNIEVKKIISRNIQVSLQKKET